ncbi:galactose-1-phosphate uridylyltransferase [Olsenella sp. An285]|uniref:UDP-glucose--hexose-1-phosphate uridylyltransferase n=1 Tax=Olsenella sp. An285 TaxID=1965621 RepID=UPI000B369582|nr:UDP-glucose--hexose-1-phosphate uridylyltransferase [Olsenella sp. An285]OUO46825.1 galactose-1-phosphate uridylyltransferase [Olsenella sp. An285]
MDEYQSGAVERGVADLVAYALDRGLIGADDVTYSANLMLDALGYEPTGAFVPREAVAAAQAADPRPALEEILAGLLDDAVARGVCDPGVASRDLLDTRLMGCVTPRPSDVTRAFWDRYEHSPEAATDWFYQLALDSDYIRTYRIARDRKWVTSTRYGDLDITINLSKPEKDPKAIAAALEKQKAGGAEPYPRCQLCPENTGYAGRLDHPARETIRIIPLTLAGEQWYLQYSPYVYYNEHCIVLSEKHVPMRIDRVTFQRLLEFVTMFPHYTVGSNADLPIVGGSILTHEHYQGGRYEFAMARAGLREEVSFPGFEDVRAGVVDWPMSVIRLDGDDPARLVELADKILAAWRGYSDETVGVLAETEGTPHNTITPIARRRGEGYELDLVLRNNRTTEEYPLGIFHPHQELHHVKKENIGLIEVMGLAVLPARLLGEMDRLKQVILAGDDPAQVPEVAAHAPWAAEVVARHPEFAPENVASADATKLDAVIEEEIGQVFAQVLEHCAVFADNDQGRAAFARFVAAVC